MNVFAYGTLRDREYQRALFGRELQMLPARLNDWMTVVAEGGFLSIVPTPGGWVDGDLLVVDDTTLAIADAGEEIPLYERVRLETEVAVGGAVTAWVYVRATASRVRPEPGALAEHSREHVLEQIRAFRATVIPSSSRDSRNRDD
jgi:gamma-glutamylcyclotransferase (GGCT)/AIG2-like uncharacterized protein YtfP